MGRVSLKNKRVLVTGGNGYLGRHLVAALEKEGALVFAISRNLTVSKYALAVDITNRKMVDSAVKKIQPDFIFHLAASLNRQRGFEAQDSVMAVNYYGTVNLLMALQSIPYQNFIFASTGEVYGNNKAPFTEKRLPAPVSSYSLSKLCAEAAIRTFSELNKKNYTIARIFNFFGPAMPREFFIPQLLQALRNNADFKMTRGRQTRDFLHVDDVVHAMLLMAKNKAARNEVFNVCSGKGITLKQLVVEMRTRIESKSRIHFGALPYRQNEIWNMVGSNGKIKNRLRFSVGLSLAKAIDKVIKTP